MTILTTFRFPTPAACFFGPGPAPRSKVANVPAGIVLAEAAEAVRVLNAELSIRPSSTLAAPEAAPPRAQQLLRVCVFS